MPAAEAQSLTHLDRRSPVLLDEASSLGYSILGMYRDDGKGNGDYYSIMGLKSDNGTEHGNCYSILGLYRDNAKENGNALAVCPNAPIWNPRGSKPSTHVIKPLT